MKKLKRVDENNWSDEFKKIINPIIDNQHEIIEWIKGHENHRAWFESKMFPPANIEKLKQDKSVEDYVFCSKCETNPCECKTLEDKLDKIIYNLLKKLGVKGTFINCEFEEAINQIKKLMN